MARVLFILTKNYIASKDKIANNKSNKRSASEDLTLASAAFRRRQMSGGGASAAARVSPAGAPAVDEAREEGGRRTAQKLPFGLDCLAGGDCCRKRAQARQHVSASKSQPVLMGKAATITVSAGDGSGGTIHLWKKARRRASLPGRKLLVGCAVASAALLLLLALKVSPWWTALLPPLVQSLPHPASVEAGGENESADALVSEAFAQLRAQILAVRSIVRRLEGHEERRRRGPTASPKGPSSSECEDDGAAALMECGMRLVARPTAGALHALRWEVMDVRRALWRLQRLRQCSQPPPHSWQQHLPDFASEAAGGAIVATPRTRAFVSDEWETLWGIPVWRVRRSPRLLIQSPPTSLQPGACWAFQGAEGQVVVALAEPARVAAVALEHVTAVVTGTRQSAPRVFEVTGLILTTDAYGVPLGRFEYDLNGPSTQTFPVKDSPMMKFRAVLLHILNNHGNPQYTCVYRFRVLGYADSGGKQGSVP